MLVVTGMKLFYLHPDDRRWLMRWFRNNLLCVAAIIAFLLILRLSAMVQVDANASFAQGTNQVVIPDGWRRTNRGWEHTTQWNGAHWSYPSSASSPPVATSPLIHPGWATIAIAIMQIAIIAAIIGFSRRSCTSDQAGSIHLTH